MKSDLTIIGLDVKKRIKDHFSNEATLDELIATLEKDKVQEVAVEKIGVSFDPTDDAVNQFLLWVLTTGIKYNHEFGLLNLDNNVAQIQIDNVRNILTAQK